MIAELPNCGSAELMVASEKRRQAAELLEQFYKGAITNDQMVNAWPHDANDRALRAVECGVWTLYSDLREHHADPEIRRHYRTSKHIHRCLTFLLSDYEYEWRSYWPLESGLDRLGITERVWVVLLRRFRLRPVPSLTPDEEAWPFTTRQDYHHAWRLLRHA